MTPENQPKKTTPIVSMKTRDLAIVEMLFRAESGETLLVASSDGETDVRETMQIDGREYRPYSSENNLLTHRVLLLPSDVGEYESNEDLLASIRSFIHRHVDLSEAFEEVAAHYVLLTWVYDRFNELPYLRVRGDYGSGKSRFLLTVGSICYKPIFASGASTVSPIFRLIDQVGGTLIVDEADFWATDERAEIVKILNNGNARGFPVLRSEVTPQKEFSPRAFNIFGPKLVATRHEFEDRALESRCLTEVLGTQAMRADIPISLPKIFAEEAQELRNRLLRYRFDHAGDPVVANDGEPDITPRRMQVIAPLLSVAVTKDARQRLREFVGGRRVDRDRSFETARQVLRIVRQLRGSGQAATVGVIAEGLRSTLGDAASGMTDKWVGGVLRGLGIEPQKSNGIYRISPTDNDLLAELYVKYGIRDVGDVGDVSTGERNVV